MGIEMGRVGMQFTDLAAVKLCWEGAAEMFQTKLTAATNLHATGMPINAQGMYKCRADVAYHARFMLTVMDHMVSLHDQCTTPGCDVEKIRESTEEMESEIMGILRSISEEEDLANAMVPMSPDVEEATVQGIFEKMISIIEF